MEMDTLLLPEGIENKRFSRIELSQYFDANSSSELIYKLRHYARNGFFKYEITIDPSYIAWEKIRLDVLLRTDVLTPIESAIIPSQSKYHLDHLYPKITNKTPLTELEIIKVIEALPDDMVERYLHYELRKVDWKKLRESIAKLPERPRHRDADWDFDTVSYKSLSVTGVVVSFNGVPIKMDLQQRQAVRVLINGRGGLCTKDDFFDAYASIFNRASYKDLNRTLIRLISDVRIKLKPFLGEDCIANTPREGWSLNI